MGTDFLSVILAPRRLPAKALGVDLSLLCVRIGSGGLSFPFTSTEFVLLRTVTYLASLLPMRIQPAPAAEEHDQENDNDDYDNDDDNDCDYGG